MAGAGWFASKTQAELSPFRRLCPGGYKIGSLYMVFDCNHIQIALYPDTVKVICVKMMI